MKGHGSIYVIAKNLLVCLEKRYLPVGLREENSSLVSWLTDIPFLLVRWLIRIGLESY